MTIAPKVLAAACSLLLLACSKSGTPSNTGGAEAAGFTTNIGAPQMKADPRMPAERLDCGNEKFAFANALYQLPGGMPDVLSSGQLMADHGEKFSVSDALEDDHTPMRRFDAAAVGQNRIFAVVEQGGVGYSIEYWAFERIGSQWVGNRRWYGGVPTSLPELLSVTCKQYAPTPQGRTNSRFSCLTPDHGSTFVSYDDWIARRNYFLNQDISNDGTKPKAMISRYPSRTLEADAADRAALLPLARIAQSSPENQCPQETVDEFIRVLEASLQAR